MALTWVKVKKVGQLAEGESEYNVIQIDEDKLSTYLGNGYELATKDEYNAQFKYGQLDATEAEGEEDDEPLFDGGEEAGDQSAGDAGVQE